MNTSLLSQCLYHVQRISKLVHMWDTLRGPGMAMSTDNLDQLLTSISPIEINTQITDEQIAPLLERIQKAERILTNTLVGDVYLNDDRDREIIVARMAMCNVLKQIRNVDDQIPSVNELWDQNDGEEWATV